MVDFKILSNGSYLVTMTETVERRQFILFGKLIIKTIESKYIKVPKKTWKKYPSYEDCSIFTGAYLDSVANKNLNNKN